MTSHSGVSEEVKVKRIKLVVGMVTCTCLILTTIFAAKAVVVYKKQTRFQVMMDLKQIDLQMLHRMRDNTLLETMFAVYPPGVTGVPLAKLKLESITSHPQDIKPWSTIPEVTNWYYGIGGNGAPGGGEVGFAAPVKKELRQAYNLAEDLLYLLTHAYDARRNDLLTDEEYMTFMNYINDAGDHPSFLGAVYFWHDGGFFDPGFAQELQRLLLADKARKELLSKIYPAILDESWPNS